MILSLAVAAVAAAALLAAHPPSPGGWPYTLSPQCTGLLLDDVWPATFFGPERVPEMRRKIDALPWAKAAYARMRAEAEQVLAGEPLQPVEPVGWRHDFYSRASGEHLLYDVHSPDRFLDPATGAYESLPAQHRAWVLLTHEQTHRRMRSMGFLYALSGDERYARWVAEGMKRAVTMFSHRELRNPKQEDALYYQPLYDAPVLLQLAHCYALTRRSPAYTQADHEAIRRGIFEEGVPYQTRYLDRHGVHNMTATALAFGPDELPAAALPAGNDVKARPGLAVFRGDDRRYLPFKAGPHGAGHDHPDKLETAAGERRYAD